jgi:hypothetical chaperone protein
MTTPARAGPSFCAIDFGTSNSAVVIADPSTSQVRLVTLEGDQPTMPTAVFYDSEDGSRRYGRAAIKAYVEGHEGRLMRSLKSILGSALVTETTHLGDGISLRYIDVIAGFLKQLKRVAEHEAGTTLTHAVIGRPVYFVDDDQDADVRAQDALRGAALSIGFEEVSFQFEPIAAALDYERRIAGERLVLVADIGGGTSDFTVIRIGGTPSVDRSGDVLANHGVHVAGTDFDQRVELDAIMPLLGYRGRTPEGREVPSRVYFDLATWHLINGVYTPRRVAELKGMRWFYDNPDHHRRLMRTVEAHLGHRLMSRAEEAKIALSEAPSFEIGLDEIEEGLACSFDEQAIARALARPLDEIVAAARETVRRAGVDVDAIHAIYFTGGSTGLRILSSRLTAAFPHAEAVYGDRFSSVASGLGVEAAARYGAPSRALNIGSENKGRESQGRKSQPT